MRTNYVISISTLPDGRYEWGVLAIRFGMDRHEPDADLGKGQEVELGLALSMASQAILRDKVCR